MNQQQPPNIPQQYVLTVSPSEAQAILDALAEMPFRVVAGLLGRLMTDINGQTAAHQAALVQAQGQAKNGKEHALADAAPDAAGTTVQ